MLYASVGSEVSTDKMIPRAMADGKIVVIPRVICRHAGCMKACIVRKPDELRPGSFGIREPRGPAVPADRIDLIAVPGLSFDRAGRRLGHGGGFYDRWLSAVPLERRIGIAFGRQLFPELPCDEHDLSVARVITEKATIHCASTINI